MCDFHQTSYKCMFYINKYGLTCWICIKAAVNGYHSICPLFVHFKSPCTLKKCRRPDLTVAANAVFTLFKNKYFPGLAVDWPRIKLGCWTGSSCLRLILPNEVQWVCVCACVNMHVCLCVQ